MLGLDAFALFKNKTDGDLLYLLHAAGSFPADYQRIRQSFYHQLQRDS